MAGVGSPIVAAWSMIAAINSPWVVRLSIRALTSPWRSSLRTRAPTIRTARPKTFRAMISRPRRVPGSQRQRETRRSARVRPRSGFAVSVSDAIERLDCVELWINVAELLAHAFDVAVDGAIIDIDLIVVSRVHQVVATLHKSGPLSQRLKQQELRDCQFHGPAFPEAVVASRIERELAALDGA